MKVDANTMDRKNVYIFNARIFISWLIMAVSFGTPRAVVLGAQVTLLALPHGAKLSSIQEFAPIAIGKDGTVAASVANMRSEARGQIIYWSRKGTAETLVTTRVLSQSNEPHEGPSNPVTVAVDSGKIFASIVARGDERGGGVVTDRWIGKRVQLVREPGCNVDGNRDRLTAAVDDHGRLATTFINLTNPWGFVGEGEVLGHPDAPHYAAPYAFVIDRNRCIPFGRGMLLNLRGDWAAGYRLYRGRRQSPYTIGHDRDIAVRWHHRKAQELGYGVAYAISRAGVAVGSNVVPDQIAGTDAVENAAFHMHAVLWNSDGHARFLETNDRSVAYGISDDLTVVGTLSTSRGVSYAFVWKNGILHRLDDLPHPPGWHFIAAYAITARDVIAGYGTYHGVPAVYTYRP